MVNFFRHVLAGLGPATFGGALLLAGAIAGCALMPPAVQAPPGVITTQVSVVDEAGTPLEAVEVWRVAAPGPDLAYLRPYLGQGRTDPSFAYLERLVARYGDVAEYAGNIRPGFAEVLPNSTLSPDFGRLDATDADGQTHDRIDYGRDWRARLSLRYAAMSLGYRPAELQVNLDAGETSRAVVLVLHRNPAVALPSAAYWKRYLDIRSHFDGRRWHEGETAQGRDQLMAAAAEADAAGDHRIAARLYGWVPFVPTSHAVSAPGVSGYERESERSERNRAVLEQAARLDPNNRYLQMKLLLLQPDADRIQRIARMEAFAAAGSDDLWPGFFLMLEDAYYSAGLKDKARAEFLQFKAFEPEHYQNQGLNLKQRAARYATLAEFSHDFVIDGDVNREDQYHHAPVYYAVRSGRVDLLGWLLDHGVSRPLPSYIFFQAVASRRPEMLRRVLDLPADITGGSHGDPRNLRRWLNEFIDSGQGDPQDLLEMQRLLESS